MRPRTPTAALVFVALIVALAAVLAAQDRPQRGLALVTNDSSSHVTVWRAAPGGYEKVWEAGARLADPASVAKTADEPIPKDRDAPLVVADYDGDGTNEVLLMDGLGITVYGTKPAYYPFETALGGSSLHSLVVADVDGDKSPEVVTLRVVSGCDVAVLKASASGLTSVWKQNFAGAGGALAVGDVNNDGKNEILIGSNSVTVLAPRDGQKWESVAEVPLAMSASAIRVADVDNDGKNEMVVLAGGKVAVFKHRKAGQSDVYPLLWQSRYLVSEGLKGSSEYGGPAALTPALAVADVDGDKQPEIIVAAVERGKLAGKELGLNSGRLHVFKFDGLRDFTSQWTSDIIDAASFGDVVAADLDGDGVNEIVYHGRAMYKHDPQAKGYRSIASVCPACTGIAVGELGELREPAAATRIVPLSWTVPGRQVSQGQTLDVAVTMRSVWAEAKNVKLTVTSEDPALEVTSAVASVPSIPAGGTATFPPVKLTGRKSGVYAKLRLDLSADGGYKQSIPARLIVGSPLPTFAPATDSRIAEAQATARAQNQRVLVIWGSNSDAASKSFLESTVKSSALSQKILYEYTVVRAEASTSDRLASKYRVNHKRAGLPSLTVLDADARLMANESLAAYKTDPKAAAGSDVKRVVDFLARHQPEYPDAQKQVRSALARAKAESKTVFIWFSAPW